MGAKLFYAYKFVQFSIKLVQFRVLCSKMKKKIKKKNGKEIERKTRKEQSVVRL